jgi:hypothetical protein
MLTQVGTLAAHLLRSDVEQFYDRYRKARELAQRRNDFLASYDASIAERYLNADLNPVLRRLIGQSAWNPM